MNKIEMQEFLVFRIKVLNWLNDNFPNWRHKFKMRAIKSYGGEVRLYDGTFIETLSNKSTFRRTGTVRNESGEIIGFNGTRGRHIIKIPVYLSICANEFNKIAEIYSKGEDDEDYMFWDDLLFQRLREVNLLEQDQKLNPDWIKTINPDDFINEIPGYDKEEQNG